MGCALVASYAANLPAQQFDFHPTPVVAVAGARGQDLYEIVRFDHIVRFLTRLTIGSMAPLESLVRPLSLCFSRHPAVARTTSRSGSTASRRQRTDSAAPRAIHEVLVCRVCNTLSHSLYPLQSCQSTECAGFADANDPCPRHPWRPIAHRAGSLVKPSPRLAFRDSEQSAEIDMRIFGSPSHMVFCSLGKAAVQIGSASRETTCRSSPDTSGSRRAGRKVRKSENSGADFQRMSTGVRSRGWDLRPISTFRYLHATTPCAAVRKSHTTGAIALPIAVGAASPPAVRPA